MSKVWTLGELASLVDAQVRGDASVKITGLGTLKSASAVQLSFLANPLYKPELEKTQAGAVLIREADLEGFTGNALVLPNPYLAYAKLSRYFDQTPQPLAGISPSAHISASAIIDPSASIAPFAYIGEGVEVGAGCVIEPGVVIHDRSRIGANSRIRSNVVIYHDCHIGDRVTLHAGVVIGADGFGFANDKGNWEKISQIGRVVIGNDVEVGANTTIDRGAIDDTHIHNGVIIDNQVQIGHNVVIGAHTAIAASTAIAGSTTIGRYCVLAGAVGVVGHITICDKVMITGMSMITKSITEPGTYSSGMGFDSDENWKRLVARFRRLEPMAKRLRDLEQAVKAIGQGPSV